MRPRILINVAFFALLGGVLAVWAATTLLHVDVIERPFPVTAEFESSPGLYPGLQVTYLGVPVGRVESVVLRPGKVDVRMELDHGAKIPEQAGAKVLRKSAIGEPYVELTAPAVPGNEILAAGDTVPLARTSGTVDYQELFDGLGDTLNAVDPSDARTLIHERSTGVNGRGDTIQDLIGDADQLTATLAANSGLLNRLAVELTGVTGTLAAHRHQLASALGNVADVTAEVKAAGGDMTVVLQQGPGFLERVEDLLQTSRPGLGCLLTAGATPGPSVFNKQTEATLSHVLSLLPTFQALLKDTVVHTPKGSFLRATALVSLAGPEAAADYLEPVPDPVAPKPLVCSATPGVSAPSRGEKPVSADAPREPAGVGSTPVADFVPLRKAADESESESFGDALPLIPVGLAAVVLTAVAARSIRTYLTGRRTGR